MTDLIDLIKQLQKENPDLLKGLDNAAKVGLQKDKMAMYDLFIKNHAELLSKHKSLDIYKVLDEILVRHENSRLDINWNRGEYIYRIVVSRRKRQEEKKITKLKIEGGDTNGEATTRTETKSAVNN